MLLRVLKYKWCKFRFQLFALRRSELLQCFIVLVLFTLLVTLTFNYFVTMKSQLSDIIPSNKKPQIDILCQTHNYVTKYHLLHQNNISHQFTHTKYDSSDSNKVIILFLENLTSSYSMSLQKILQHIRIPFLQTLASENLPVIIDTQPSTIGVIVFEHFSSYLNLELNKRQKLDAFLLKFNVGMISFVQKVDVVKSKFHKNSYEGPHSYLGDFPVTVQFDSYIRDFFISNTSPVLKITKRGRLMDLQINPDQRWSVMTPMNDSQYDSIAFTKKEWFPSKLRTSIDTNTNLLQDIERRSVVSQHDIVMKSLVLHDLGKVDNIERILFSGPPEFWLNKLLLLDSIQHLSHYRISIPLQRFIQIDIDDIFVGKTGTRLTVDDIDAMIIAQRKWAEHFIPGFRFNVGFSGKYFMKQASHDEMQGDQYLIKRKDEFHWFCHSWGHKQSHKYQSLNKLLDMFNRNKEFAKTHGIRVDSGYSVAPHHSGVFPVHPILYEAWKQVWNISVTSTEEYPHLHPARSRRGFIHKGIKVLPRQVCGIYTHTTLLDDYPGGPQKLVDSIMGGQLFETVLCNMVSPFMTHMSNYCCDRLALYTFDALFRFVSCWTNLELRTDSPIALAQFYFSLYPEEKKPVWVDHCQDKRHREILPKQYSCKLPQFIIVGPQKTGTTALSTFLTVHPQLVKNIKNKDHFEEIQFFSSNKEYQRTVSWYSAQFPAHSTPVLINDTLYSAYLFEKSATYFDSLKAPARIKSLIPNVKLVFVFVNPVLRAYSWYQHMKSKGDPTALRYSFHDVITAPSNSHHELLALKKRCLLPGKYRDILNQWFRHFSIHQMHFVDGAELKTEPANCLLHLQRFLGLNYLVDYRSILEFNKRKGFFCFNPNFMQRYKSQNKNRNDLKLCLGRGKGRIYSKISQTDYDLLSQYYYPQNVALYKLFQSMSISIPGWLSEEIDETN